MSIGGSFIGDGLPLWVVGKYDPTQSLVATPALGEALARELSAASPRCSHRPRHRLRRFVALWARQARIRFRMNAIIQQKAILLGGDITYLEGQDGDTLPSSVVPTGSGRGQGAARFWEVLEPSGVAGALTIFFKCP